MRLLQAAKANDSHWGSSKSDWCLGAGKGGNAVVALAGGSLGTPEKRGL